MTPMPRYVPRSTMRTSGRQSPASAERWARIVGVLVFSGLATAYILWKIERHSGVRVEVTPRQRRHPFIFALPLFWRLYRQGAFR